MATQSIIVVNNGLQKITNCLVNDPNPPEYMAWGTGAANAIATNTNLQTARPEAREAAVMQLIEDDVADDTLEVVATLIVTAEPYAANITELGIFNHITNEDLFLRATFDPLALGEDDGIQFTVRVKFESVGYVAP